MHVQIKLINHNLSFDHLVDTRERDRDYPFWLTNQSGAPLYDLRSTYYHPQPWEADLTHIKHSQLSSRGLIEQIVKIQAYS